VTLLRLALRDIRRSAFRSWTIATCAFLVAALGLSALLLARGARASLDLVSARLGADIVVVPSGATTQVEAALLMGVPTRRWLPSAVVGQIRALPNVAAASPQLYLASLANASCCTVSNMFLVAFDPATDFTVQPWIREQVGASGLPIGGAVGGSLVAVPPGEKGLTLYGYPLDLKARLAPTGTNLDRSIFLTFETARDMASRSVTAAAQPLEVPSDGVSAVMVKVADGSEARGVASLITDRVKGVTASVAPSMFGAFRDETGAVLSGLLAALAVTGGFSLVFIALVSSMAAHDRRRELGVLRALGATRAGVVGLLVVQAAAVTAAGAATGAAVAAAGIYLFRDLIVRRSGIPLLFPAPGELALLVIAGVLSIVIGVSLAVALPASRTAIQEPATSMRE
jgi:putative ABC transport system permease protein